MIDQRVIVLREILAGYGYDDFRNDELRDMIRDLDEADPMRSAVLRLRGARDIPGANPTYHRAIAVRTRHDWPSLMAAIDQTIKEL